MHQIRLPLWGFVTLLLAVTLATYFLPLLATEGGFQHLSQAQYVGAIIPVGLVFGITAATRPADPTVVARVTSQDETTGVPTVVAGEAARYETDSTLGKNLTLSQLVDPHATRLGRHDGEPTTEGQ